MEYVHNIKPNDLRRIQKMIDENMDSTLVCCAVKVMDSKSVTRKGAGDSGVHQKMGRELADY
ncbi:MAG: hypothetical protein IJM05_07410 [Bacteroidales bacterium]|nr:hypothetical protein [Bacteroidales bacterium]